MPGLRSGCDYSTRTIRMPEFHIEKTALLEDLSRLHPALALHRILHPTETPSAKRKVRDVLLRFLRDMHLCERW